MINNSVADYKIRTSRCDKCGGTGKLYFKNTDELIEYAKEQSLTYKEGRDLVRTWQKYGEIDCDRCKGEGIIEKWI